jgi:5-methylthioribose kinase
LFELTAQNAAAYLAARGIESPREVTELGGGVSNTVLLIETADRRFVLKQSLGKLRVEQDWFSERERIFREASAMKSLAPALPRGALPEVLFEDHPNCTFAMTAAPAGAETWKSQLLAGKIDPEIARIVGVMLGAIARASWNDPRWEHEFGDQTVFDQLRLDPYYRSTASRHPDLAPCFERLIEDSAARRFCLVHGDWSPKNFLVEGRDVMAIDFEVIHYGDPAFDAGFLLNHLALKAMYRPAYRALLAEAAREFWHAYIEALPEEALLWIEAATLRHLGCLMLARVDGKSPAEYLRDTGLRERVRQFARGLIERPPARVAEVFEAL